MKAILKLLVAMRVSRTDVFATLSLQYQKPIRGNQCYPFRKF